MKSKLSGVPAVIPGPHLAASVQVVVPFGTTVQPWLVSRLLAWPGLNGNGSPFRPVADSHLVAGVAATGPTVTAPYPRIGPLMIAAWFIRHASAWRKYSCLMTAARAGTAGGGL